MQPFLGGGEFTNAISGKIRLAKEVLVTLDGHWDDEVIMKDKKTGVRDFLMSMYFMIVSHPDRFICCLYSTYRFGEL